MSRRARLRPARRGRTAILRLVSVTTACRVRSDRRSDVTRLPSSCRVIVCSPREESREDSRQWVVSRQSDASSRSKARIRCTRSCPGTKAGNTTDMASCLALILALALSAQSLDQPTVTIRVSAESGPVTGARVRAGGESRETDARGMATIQLQRLPTEVTVEAEGFVSASLQVAEVRPDRALDVHLDRLPE